MTKYTDAKGATFLTAGLGDMIVWASKNGKYGYKKVTFGKDREVTIALDRDNDAVSSVDMAIVPPKESPNVPEVSADRSMLPISFVRRATGVPLRLSSTDIATTRRVP